MSHNKILIKGIFLALVTSIISGIAIFYSKIAVHKIDPLVLTTSRNFYVAIIFLAGFLLMGKWKEIKNINRKQTFQLLLIGLIGGSIPFFLFFTGLSMINAQLGNLIHKTLFVWVGLLSVIFLKEKFNIIYLISYLLVFLGTFAFTKINFHFGLGEMLVLVATLLWSVENIIAKKALKDISSELVGLSRMGVGSIILLITTFVSGKGSILLHLNQNQILTIIIGGSILAFYVYFWYKALKFAPASLVTLVLTFSVVVGTVLNGSLAGIKISVKEVWSVLLLTTGLLFVYIKILTPFIGQFLSNDETKQ